jgi:hypothetical protein
MRQAARLASAILSVLPMMQTPAPIWFIIERISRPERSSRRDWRSSSSPAAMKPPAVVTRAMPTSTAAVWSASSRRLARTVPSWARAGTRPRISSWTRGEPGTTLCRRLALPSLATASVRTWRASGA